MAEPQWRLLVVRGRDALLQRDHRVMFARRSEARLVAAVVFFAIQPISLLAMLIHTDFEGIGVAVCACLGLVLAWFATHVYGQMRTYHFFDPMFTIDVRAGVLLDARNTFVAALPDFRLTMIGENASHGFELRYDTEQVTVLQEAGDDLTPALQELRALGFTAIAAT